MSLEAITKTKPRIMLIPDSVCWILGTWAKEIVKWNSEKYEFIIFPMTEIAENEKLFLCVLNEVDIVHCLTPWGFSKVKTIIDNNKITNITVISTIHHIVEFSQVESCFHADKIMVVCKKYLDELILKGVPKDKLFLIYNGVDTDFFSLTDKIRSRVKLGISKEDFTIGFSAKASSDHDGRKGVDIFLRVISNLSTNLKDDLHLIITGPGWDEMIKNITSNNIHIHYFPFLPIEQMPDFYKSLNLYLVTAKVEGGPVPLLEAMSCGTPVITTPVGTALDFVRDGINGLTVPIGDVEGTVKAIQKLYCDRILAENLGLAGRDTILKNLQWKNTVSKICMLYGTAINNRKIYDANLKLHSFSKLTRQLIKRDEKRWNRRDQLQLSAFKNFCIYLSKLRKIIK